MKTVLQNIQNVLATITELKYVDENWGQLDYYAADMPVQFPCCLIDITTANYNNIGKDISVTPQNRQNADIQIEITIANLKLSNTSFRAPVEQKNQAWQILNWIEITHQKLQGFRAADYCGNLIRTSFTRTKRDDGVQEYKITYSAELYNV